MNENLDPTTSGYNSEEFDLEKIETIIDDFAGQDQILENLKVFVEAANQRNDFRSHPLPWSSGFGQDYFG
jgi:Holliday junction DNA helicase RuvB